LSRRRRHSGFSLTEILVGIAIMALVLGGAVYGFRAITKSELRSSSSKLAGAIRYCFDRAITTGKYYRLVLDLDGQKYWAERSDERMYLKRDKERGEGRGKAFDWDKEEKRLDDEEREEAERYSGSNQLAKTLEPAPKAKRAKFQTFKDASAKQVALKRVKLADVYTARQEEPYTSGRAYLYFFPDGHTERAVVRLQDGASWYSLIVHSLTGRVEVKNGKYDIPRNFDEKSEVSP
jgi:general secretion pathway protein H